MVSVEDDVMSFKDEFSDEDPPHKIALVGWHVLRERDCFYWLLVKPPSSRQTFVGWHDLSHARIAALQSMKPFGRLQDVFLYMKFRLV